MKLSIWSYFSSAALAVAQTGIGTRTPDKSAVLTPLHEGFLMPRMSTDERDLIENPANALYNTQCTGNRV
jgi:hypothetical protein